MNHYPIFVLKNRGFWRERFRIRHIKNILYLKRGNFVRYLPTVLFPRQIRGSTVGADGNFCTIVLGRPLLTDQGIRISTFL